MSTPASSDTIQLDANGHLDSNGRTDRDWLKPFSTVPEFANYLGICRAHGAKIVASGEVPSFKVGRCRRIARAAILEYVRKLQAGE